MFEEIKTQASEVRKLRDSVKRHAYAAFQEDSQLFFRLFGNLRPELKPKFFERVFKYQKTWSKQSFSFTPMHFRLKC